MSAQSPRRAARLASVAAVSVVAALPAGTQTYAAPAERSLTIGGHRHGGVYRQGASVVARGGFSANGYGDPVATPQERREADNARLRARSSGLYGYGVDGLGSTFLDNRETGYDNPFYGNAYTTYVGYNGLPTALAFGPGFANRYAAEHDPADDDEPAGPSPSDLGFGIVPRD